MTVKEFKQIAEYLGGARDESPVPVPPLSNWWFWGLWWNALSILIYISCGQSSKFIYIDF